MPRPHISMRKIRDALRLSLGEGLSLRHTAASLQMPFTTLGDHLRRARAAGITCPKASTTTPSRRSCSPPPPRRLGRPARCRTGPRSMSSSGAPT